MFYDTCKIRIIISFWKKIDYRKILHRYACLLWVYYAIILMNDIMAFTRHCSSPYPSPFAACLVHKYVFVSLSYLRKWTQHPSLCVWPSSWVCRRFSSYAASACRSLTMETWSSRSIVVPGGPVATATTKSTASIVQSTTLNSNKCHNHICHCTATNISTAACVLVCCLC